MRQGMNHRQLGLGGGWWCADMCAQRAIQRVAGHFLGAIAGLDQELDRARARADQLHRLGVDQRRRHRNTDRQDKPRQHKAGEPAEAANGLHNAHCKSASRKTLDRRHAMASPRSWHTSHRTARCVPVQSLTSVNASRIRPAHHESVQSSKENSTQRFWRGAASQAVRSVRQDAATTPTEFCEPLPITSRS